MCNCSSATSSQALYFDHETYFGHGHICKIFRLNAPAQSGEELHSHDYFQIWYVTRGNCWHNVEGATYEMSVGDAFLLPPNVTHKTVLEDEGSIICCEFFMEDLFHNEPSLSNKIWEVSENISFTLLSQQELQNTQPKFTLSREGQLRVEKLLLSMLDEYTNAEKFYEDCLHLQILELLLIFAREYAQSPSHDFSKKTYDKYRAMVKSTIEYIDHHFDEPLTLDGMCKMSMLSKTYFCYIFKLLTRQTFVEYLTEQRINHAMELLRQSSISIIDISLAVGFRDSTHFSRTFRKLRGISPREYRSTARIHKPFEVETSKKQT